MKPKNVNKTCACSNATGYGPLSHQHRREREPSRIPAKKICRLLTKSRKLRKAFQKKIKRDIPD